MQAQDAILMESPEAVPEGGGVSTRVVWTTRPTEAVGYVARGAVIQPTFKVSESTYFDQGSIVREEVPHDRRDSAARVEDFLGLVQRWRFMRGRIDDDVVGRVVESLWRQHEGDG